MSLQGGPIVRCSATPFFLNFAMSPRGVEILPDAAAHRRNSTVQTRQVVSLELSFRDVEKHRGRYTEFLTLYEVAAAAARTAGSAAYEKFCSCLPTLVSDERNLNIAMDHLR